MKTAEINKLGKELELYTYVDYIGKGFPIILPKGSKVIEIIRNYVEAEEEKNGYQILRTPSVSRAEIYMIEDRFENQKDDMYIIETENSIGDREENCIVLRPDVSPFHCAVYNTKQRSYKALPIKYSETAAIFRNEKDIKGIGKTKQITMSDESIFVMSEDLSFQIKEAIELSQKFISKLGLDVTYKINNWDCQKKEEYIGTIDEWNFAVEAMKNALNSLNIPYEETKRAEMFGPSIQIYYEDREFCGLQIDFEIVHRFETTYVSKDNKYEYPVYIRRTAVGSYENLLGILIEKYQGDFPLWIAPVQVIVILEDDEYRDFAKEVINKMLHKGIRAEEDMSDTNIQNKEYRAVDMKIPYIIKIGESEYKRKKIKVRTKDYIKDMNIEELIEEVIHCQEL